MLLHFFYVVGTKIAAIIFVDIIMELATVIDVNNDYNLNKLSRSAPTANFQITKTWNDNALSQ